MKIFILIFVFISSFGQVFSQDYDLIVKSNRDSIACHIDSISDTHIYFKVKYRGKWVPTNIEKHKVTEFQYLSLDKKKVRFKPGTSKLSSNQSNTDINSLFDIPQNSVSLESNIAFTSINYGRLFPLKNRTGITVGAGINYFAFGDWFFTGETTLLLGGPKHFFEPGVELYISDKDEIAVYPGIGYRFQGFNGLLFKAYLGYQNFDEPGVMPMIAIGYSF